MSKIYFIEDNFGEFASEDGKRKFKKISGKRAYDYLQSEEGRSKRFMKTEDDNGDEINVEIPENFLKTARVIERREQYQRDTAEEFASVPLSLDEALDGDSDDSITLGDTIADESADVFEEVVKKVNLETLRKALKSLSEEEYDLIYHLYLKEDTLSEREYAKLLGLTQKAINFRKSDILWKLKKFF